VNNANTTPMMWILLIQRSFTMQTPTETRNLDIFPREFIIYILEVVKRDDATVSNFFACGNKTVSVDNNFLFALDLNDFGAAIWRTTMINEPCDIPRFRR
jgi:hypothetical protein